MITLKETWGYEEEKKKRREAGLGVCRNPLSEAIGAILGTICIATGGVILFVHGCGNWSVLSWESRLIVLAFGAVWMFAIGVFIWWLDGCPPMYSEDARY